MKDKEPMIQIPASLMLDLCRYHLSEMQDDPRLQGRIRAGLYRKLDAIRRRTEYKDSLHTDEQQP